MSAPTEKHQRSTSQAGSMLRVAWVRLRFVIVFLLVFLVVGKWETVAGYWEKWTGQLLGAPKTAAAVGEGTDYFCPMCPGVLSKWPAKCPICNMPLVRKQKSEMGPLPDGALARLQVSPYRLQLGGVATSPVEYQELIGKVSGIGRLTTIDEARERDAPGKTSEAAKWTTSIAVSPEQQPLAFVGQGAQIEPLDGQMSAPLTGKIASIEPTLASTGKVRVKVEVSGVPTIAPAITLVRVTLSRPLAETEPYRSQPRDATALTPTDERTLYVCPNHPQQTSVAPGRCPLDAVELMAHDLAPNERMRWRCPLHHEVTAIKAGETCPKCAGLELRPYIVEFAPHGKVLAVPESAVVDAGVSVVYVESMPGIFDAVVPKLGAAQDGYLPIIEGLSASARVVSRGAFLLDAETRLDPNLAATYFGAASGGGRTVSATRGRAAEKSPQKLEELLSGLELSPVVRALALRQKTCPITQQLLGSMGAPIVVKAEGQTVLLCCPGCKERFAALHGETSEAP